MKLLILCSVVLAVTAQRSPQLYIKQSNNQIITGEKYTRSAIGAARTSIDEVAGQDLGDLTTDLQIQAQAALNDLLANPSNADSIIQTLAMRMAQSIATLISQLAQEGISNPIEEAAQISAAVRLALEATLAGANGIITSQDVIVVINQLVGQLENILTSSSINLPTQQIQQIVLGPLLNALQQVFGIPITAPAVVPMPVVAAPTTPPVAIAAPQPPANSGPTTVVQTPAISDIAGGSYQTFIFTSSGKRVLVGGCFDIVPPGGFTCEEQKSLGKCGRRWMSEGTFCADTCGYCIDQCLDIQPDLETTCQQVKQLDLCNSEGILANSFCKSTCNNCGDVNVVPSEPAASVSIDSSVGGIPSDGSGIEDDVVLESCVDVSPDPQYTCDQQLEFGKCDAAWMVQGQYCSKTCGRCGAIPSVIQPDIIQVSNVAPVFTSCTDVVPDGKYTCEQQKEFGKCNAQWMLSGGYCQQTCDRCTTQLLTQQTSSQQLQQQNTNNNNQCNCECPNTVNQGVDQSETVAQLLAAAIEQVLQDLGV